MSLPSGVHGFFLVRNVPYILQVLPVHNGVFLGEDGMLGYDVFGVIVPHDQDTTPYDPACQRKTGY